MRDRVTEFLPLLLAGAVLLVFQLTRGGGLAMPSASSGAGLSPTAQSTSAVNTPPTLAQRRLPLAPLPTATAASVALCSSAEPHFVGGMLTLKGTLGAPMGDPLECERSVDNQGDTQQKTTTGLAYYRRQTNYPCFTTGWDHWGLVDGSIVHWAGDAVDPPLDAVAVSH